MAKAAALPSRLKALETQAALACELIKALGNRWRLMVLCHLVDGEKTVGDLEHALDMRQPTLSQHLARLRKDGLVESRRAGKTVYYSVASAEATAVIALLCRLYGDERDARFVALMARARA
ncbi:MAG: winged helix-turn-helix transcriptional regulator [Alphaproteobacteria bacterium]|nr:winged helix-turn-helix transcriptional regulator [Alphaproteobacteria bacterium]